MYHQGCLIWVYMSIYRRPYVPPNWIFTLVNELVLCLILKLYILSYYRSPLTYCVPSMIRSLNFRQFIRTIILQYIIVYHQHTTDQPKCWMTSDTGLVYKQYLIVTSTNPWVHQDLASAYLSSFDILSSFNILPL